MAGHSKWSNIKHRKAGQDAKRSKIFTKIIRELTVSARDGGGNIDDNPTLRAVVEKAKTAQMPKDTIERAITRGAGGKDGSELVALTYEGYGPGGIAVFVETMTDNRNRTVSEIRHAFTKAHGNLGTDGSVAYLFNKRGILGFHSVLEVDNLVETAIEAGAEDVTLDDDGSLEIITLAEDFLRVKDRLEGLGFEPSSAVLTMLPQTVTDLDVETGEKVFKLLEMLDDIDDVTAVHTNANFPLELISR